MKEKKFLRTWVEVGETVMSYKNRLNFFGLKMFVFQQENRLGHSHSLCDVSCIDGFAARLFKWQLQQQPQCWRFFFFVTLVIFSSLTALMEQFV
jgi:hypothetical protein